MKIIFKLSKKKKVPNNNGYETLVNKKPHKGLVRVLKISSLLLIMSSITNGQVYTDLGAGVAYVAPPKQNSYAIPILKLAVGYQLGNIVGEAVAQPSISRKTNSPVFLGVKAGYNIYGITPMVGYLYDYCNSDNTEMNKWVASYGVKLQRNINENGNIYGELMYTKISYGFTVGVNIPF